MTKKVLIAGLGISGIQAARLLMSNGEDVILYDGNAEKNKDEIRTLIDGEAEIVLGELKPEVTERVSYCIISPGISLEVPFVQTLMAAGIEIRSEIEASFMYEKGTVIGITGTNGKTTTTALTGHIMKAFLGEGKAFTVGNIGIPYSEDVMKTSADSVTTIELSSFQLETVSAFRPHAAAILNITPDHLNRHHTMECYADVKARIAKNQTPEDYIVLNYEDPRLRALASGMTPKVIWFSGGTELTDGYYLKDGVMYVSENGHSERLLGTDEVLLVGRCNYENILAAIAITEAMGVPRETILKAVRTFKAVPHRIEFVREVDGVRYYNDSKGTNVDAAVQGIRAMTSKTVLIGGGYDKGSDYDDWIEAFDGKVKKLILIGQTREKIAACAERHGFTDYEFADDFGTAVERARQIASPGENVLLSPACASWGMFKNYEERGDIFKDMIRNF